MGKTSNKTMILGIMITAVFILGILTIDFASANHPQNAGYRFSQFVEDLASHFPVTSVDIVDGTITSADIADGTITAGDLVFDTATQTELDTHTAGASAHHAATVDTLSDIEAVCTANQVARTDGAGNWACTNNVQAINAGNGLTGGGTGDVIIDVDTGTTANKIVQLDGSARLPAVDGSQLTNIAHTVDTNAGTICAAGQFLNGDGTCDAGFLDADGVDDFGNPAYVMIQLTSNGSTSSAQTKFGAGGSEIVILNGISWNGATNRVVIVEAGVYEIVLSAYMSTQAVQGVDIDIVKNAVVTVNSVQPLLHTTTDPDFVGISYLDSLNAADTIEIRFNTVGTGSANFNIGSTLIVKRIA